MKNKIRWIASVSPLAFVCSVLLLAAPGCSSSDPEVLAAQRRMEKSLEQLTQELSQLKGAVTTESESRLKSELAASTLGQTLRMGVGESQLRDDALLTEISKSATVASANLAELRSMLAARADDIGAKARASQASELAEVAASANRRSDAALLMMSAATADPSNSKYAIRLGEYVLNDAEATPPALGSTALALRALAIQGSGESVLEVWRVADALDAAQEAREAAAADFEIAEAARDAQRGEIAARDASRELVARNFLDMNQAERAESYAALAAAIDEVGIDATAVRQKGMETLERWQRIVQFDAALTAVSRAVESIEAEVKADNATGVAVPSLIASAEGVFRILWMASKSEIGEARWTAAEAQQLRFAEVGEKVLEARDMIVLGKLSALANDAKASASAVIGNLGGRAPAGGKNYESAIKDLGIALGQIATVSRELGARTSSDKAAAIVEPLAGWMQRLRESQYESYVRVVTRLVKNAIDAYTSQGSLSDVEAEQIARQLYEIDAAGIPSPVAEAYNSIWQSLIAEFSQANARPIMLGRLEATKLAQEQF